LHFGANNSKIRKKTLVISSKIRFTKMHHPTSFYTKTPHDSTPNFGYIKCKVEEFLIS